MLYLYCEQKNMPFRSLSGEQWKCGERLKKLFDTGIDPSPVYYALNLAFKAFHKPA